MDKNGENVSHLEITVLVLVHVFLLLATIFNKSFGRLLDILPK